MSSSIKDRLHPNSVLKNHYGGYQRYSPRFILGYWSTRCLGAPLRMMLSAAQIDHWVVMYDATDTADGTWDKSTWLRDKAWLKEKFPLINLPFLVDCAQDCIICQTNAIAMYLGRELKLVGTTREEISMCEELLCEITDLRNLMIDFAYKTDQSTCKQDAQKLLQDAQKHFERLEHHLMQQYPEASDRFISRDELNTIGFHMKSVCHLIKGKFTVPDFHLWEILDQYEGLCKRFSFPNCLGDATTCSEKVDVIKTWETPTEKNVVFPYLKEFKDSFIHLPANMEYGTKYGLNYVTSHRAIKLPYNNSYARFGSCPDQTQTFVTGQVAPWRNKGEMIEHYTRIGTGIDYWDDKALERARKRRGGDY